MNTPIADFVREYSEKNAARFHMPGHKGKAYLGCESLDITEIAGADALYEADGIIKQSENNASKLFGTGVTLYSAGGSTQCIKAMLYLAATDGRNTGNAILAARNVHKAFVFAAAQIGFDTQWLYGGENKSICSCNITAQDVENALKAMEIPPIAVYVTSPDYLGNMLDIKAISQVCHKYGTLLLVDNAHGAYLHFLKEPCHPMDLGADMCCDSAHKTLPVLTGGAYLHINKCISGNYLKNAKLAMSMFGSTSPSYLILASLDLCNKYLSSGYTQKLDSTAAKVENIREKLRENGWDVQKSDQMRITVAAPEEMTGTDLAGRLKEHNAQCEYADRDFLVLMITPENTDEELEIIHRALGKNNKPTKKTPVLPAARASAAMSIRDALFAPHECIKANSALGRICAAPTVSCPPAVPIAVSGELIGKAEIELFNYYGIDMIDAVK